MTKVVHVIPVPVGVTVEESWRLIRAGALLIHPRGEPSWGAVLVNADEELVEVLDLEPAGEEGACRW